jgi:hypothetical protein
MFQRDDGDFAMLTCATNFFQCLEFGRPVGCAPDRNFSSARSLLVVVDRSGPAVDRDFADACS